MAGLPKKKRRSNRASSSAYASKKSDDSTGGDGQEDDRESDDDDDDEEGDNGGDDDEGSTSGKGKESSEEEDDDDEDDEKEKKKRQEVSSSDDSSDEDSDSDVDMEDTVTGVKATPGSYQAAILKQSDIITKERAIVEMKWQGKTEKQKTLKKEWVENIVTSQKPLTFICMTPGSGTLLVIHSIARYAGDPLNPSEAHHKLIGFIGNGGEGAPDPQPVFIDEKDLGKWITKEIVTEGKKLAPHFKANRYDVYVTPKATKNKKRNRNDEVEMVTVPLLCLVPSVMVPWLLAKNRTPFELAKKSLTYLEGKLKRKKDVDVFETFMLYCLMAAQGSSKKSRHVSISPSPVFQPDRDLSTWLNQRITTALGAPRRIPTTAQATATATLSQEEVIQQSKELYERGLQDGATGNRGTSGKKKKELSEDQKVQLAGFSNVDNPDDTEIDLWDRLLGAGTREEARSILIKAYMKTARRMNLEVQARNWWPSTNFMDAIRKFNLTPHRNATFADLMDGLNITEFFKLSNSDRIAAQSEEKAQDETMHTRTISESRQLKAKTVRTPPSEYYEMINTITAYVIAVVTLFAEECKHYKGVWAVRMALKDNEDAQDFYKPQTFREICWTIIADARQFLSTVVDEDDFKNPNFAKMPDTNLGYIARQLLHKQPFQPMDFPIEWVSVPSVLPSVPSGPASAYPGSNTQFQQTGGQSKTHSDVHPKLKNLMAPFWAQSTKAPNFLQILKCGGKVVADLPKHVTDSKAICYHYITGRCNRFGCRNHHLEKSKVPSQFVTDFCTVLAPCLPLYLASAQHQRGQQNNQQ